MATRATASTPPEAETSGEVSRSAIVAMRGYHAFRIDGYSTTTSARSTPFRAGGRTWHVEYRAGWSRRDNTDFITVYLSLDDDVGEAEAVMAQATFTLLDHADGNKPVPEYSRTTARIDFSVRRSCGIGRFISMEELVRSEHLKNDSFTIGCHVITTMDESPSVLVPPPDMRHQLGDLLSTKEGADVELLVGGESFAAHRCVLAARSPVLKSKLSGPTKKRTIQIDGMEPRVFGAMLTFIYTDAWPSPPSRTTEHHEPGEEATMAHQLLVAAEKYGLPRLKLICENKLCGHINTRSVLSILAIAERHRCACLKAACMEFLGSSGAHLRAAIETDGGLDYLARRCPGVIKQLMLTVIGRDLEKQMEEMHVN
ncbi:hypothetical protein E2562_030869 [Oryza meyeriana var. granulata]|uniref:BTB domain-containing protein n=1 Tax=Oryza meyeriana var. granulata TaxID=110450 RepID=A0A6G1F008_9ORYZ|nr:hypothetical protein E2562_030869 [Oryza meyeriana var. granulata]